MTQKRSKFPRSAGPLLVVMLVVVVGFIFLQGNDQDPDFTLGGHVFPVAAEDIMVMRLTKGNTEYRFERFGAGGWSLSGAASDYLDPKAMADLVEFLVAVESGSVLPGTTPEDRRYGFDGNDALRLAVFATEGREFRLALGVANPVTAGIYASGAGRPGCFPVGQGLRNKLRALPVSVQENKILPPFDLDDLTEVEVWRGSEKLILRPEDARWWLKEPADGMAQLSVAFRNYNAVYGDRRRVVDGQPWLLAENRVVEEILYESSQTLVRDILSPAETPEKMEEWSMQPSWREIVFHGSGINSDPATDSPNALALSYGPPLGSEYVPFLRRENLMLGDALAVKTLGLPLGQWLNEGAMPFRVEVGDSLKMEREGSWVVSAYPGQEADISRWVGVFSGQDDFSISEKERLNVIENLIVNLDRLEIVQVMQPTDKAWILQDTDRVGLDFWTSGEGMAGRHRVEFGWLDLDHLPGGDVEMAVKLAEERDGQKPAGMWVPGTGMFMQIPAHLVISFRNMGGL